MFYMFVDLHYNHDFVWLKYVNCFFSLTFSATHEFHSQHFNVYRDNTFGRIVVEIGENILFFILTSIRSIFASLRSSGEALLVKMYSSKVFQYPELVLKGLITVKKVRVVTLN